VAVGDAEVFDDAVNPVRRVVDLPARDPQHGLLGGQILILAAKIKI
jgi:hypothetical protein